jgi:energy-converting hydrogenase Eha subunit G
MGVMMSLFKSQFERCVGRKEKEKLPLEKYRSKRFEPIHFQTMSGYPSFLLVFLVLFGFVLSISATFLSSSQSYNFHRPQRLFGGDC